MSFGGNVSRAAMHSSKGTVRPLEKATPAPMGMVDGDHDVAMAREIHQQCGVEGRGAVHAVREHDDRKPIRFGGQPRIPSGTNPQGREMLDHFRPVLLQARFERFEISDGGRFTLRQSRIPRSNEELATIADDLVGWAATPCRPRERAALAR